MPQTRIAMSLALIVLVSIALVLVLGLVIALRLLASVEKEHEEASGVRTEERPARASKSADLHVFLAFPKEHALATRFADEPAAMAAEQVRTALSDLLVAVSEATSGLAEFGHFRPIPVQPLSGHAIVYLHARVRTPIRTFVELDARDRYRETLEALAALDDASFVEVTLGRATLRTDPALGRLRELV